MRRTVDVSALTDREKENAVLVLSGYARHLRSLLEEEARDNRRVRRRLEDVARTYGPRLAFLERAWFREAEDRVIARSAARNDRVWEQLARREP